MYALNRDAFESHSLSYRCYKQTDDGQVVYITCISVYWRFAVVKFLKSTMYKLLTWPWPCPLREHSLITRLRLRMADLCTKFEVSSFSHCRDFTWGVKFWVTWPWPRPFRGRFFIGRVVLAMVSQCIKFEVSRFTRYEAMNGSAQCTNWGSLGHSRSSAMSPFDRVLTTSYSTLIETMRLSCTVFEI